MEVLKLESYNNIMLQQYNTKRIHVKKQKWCAFLINHGRIPCDAPGGGGGGCGVWFSALCTVINGIWPPSLAVHNKREAKKIIQNSDSKLRWLGKIPTQL